MEDSTITRQLRGVQGCVLELELLLKVNLTKKSLTCLVVVQPVPERILGDLKKHTISDACLKASPKLFSGLTPLPGAL